MSVTISKIDLLKSKQSIVDKMVDLCKRNDHIKRLTEAKRFFNSCIWKNIRNNSSGNAHSITNEYLSVLFDPNEFAIYDNGTPLYDKGNIISKLDKNQRSTLDKIDSLKGDDIYNSNGILMMYIGSSVLFTGYVEENGSNYIEFKITTDKSEQYDFQVNTGTQINFTNGVSYKINPGWVTIAKLSYTVIGSEIDLNVEAINGFSINAPGSYTINFPNSHLHNGSTYTLSDQVIKAEDNIEYTISGNTLSFSLPDSSFSLKSGTYENLLYTKD